MSRVPKPAALDAATVPLSGTTLIEASAGTGKTYTIATLFVRLLVEHGHSVSEILVVTYTRAATAELRARIRKRVVEALDVLTRVHEGKSGGADEARDAALWVIARASLARGSYERDRQRLIDAVRSFDLASISTIHGFCQRVLKHSAFESGTDFDLELIDDERALIDEVIKDYWVRSLYDARPDFLERLSALKVTPSMLADIARRAVAQPELCVVPNPKARDTRELEERRREAFERVFDLYAESATELRKLVSAERHVTQRSLSEAKLEATIWPWFAARTKSVVGKRPDWLEYLCAGKLPLNKAAKGVQPKHPFFDACTQLFESDAALTQALDDNVYAFVHGCLEYVREALAARKAERRVQSFDDLLLRLRTATSGKQGRKLLARIRAQHPAALIDEFQDTDPVQSELFQRIYASGSHAPGVLFFIGDPKQAIYGFRGADLFAYMAAARSAEGRRYTLGVNRRSDPKMVRAVNHLFEQVSAPFVYEEIAFAPVESLEGRRDVLDDGEAALDFVLVPSEQEGRGADSQRQVAEHVADDIVARLSRGDTLEDAPTAPQDIAVLCRTNKQAVMVQEALRARGVPTVLDGDRSVFESVMARELEQVLSAMCEPSDAALVRGALVTSVFGVGAKVLAGFAHDDDEWDRWVRHFHDLQKTWETQGFVQAMHALFDTHDVRARLLSLRDGERRLTDLLHLVELVQTEVTRTGEGPFALLSWYRRVVDGELEDFTWATEAAQVRLESDAMAVTLTTIHKSKGLEYPIVYLPYLWASSTFKRERARPHFHDAAHEHRPTLALDGHDEAVKLYDREALAENLRLLYVALTRARHKVVVVWGAYKEMGRSSLAYLVHREPRGPREPHAIALDEVDALARATAERASKLKKADVVAELKALATSSRGSIAVRTFLEISALEYGASTAQPRGLRARTLERVVVDVVQTSSFSRMTSGSYALPQATDEALDRDPVPARDGAVVMALPDADAPRIALADFASGATQGHLIHEIFEHLDLRSDEGAYVALARDKLVAYGMDESKAGLLGRALHAAASTPLGQGKLSELAQVAPEDCLRELEFVFPVALKAADGSLGGDVRARALSRVLRAHATTLDEQLYAERVSQLSSVRLRGYLRGFVDLVVRHRKRYYVLDYKSNHLGPHARDYGRVKLWEAMSAHHYVLQYLLYTVALHRYLRLRVPSYEYETHFGGVYYLFVRGMASAHPPGSGVFYDRPSPALVHALDALFLEGSS